VLYELIAEAVGRHGGVRLVVTVGDHRTVCSPQPAAADRRPPARGASLNGRSWRRGFRESTEAWTGSGPITSRTRRGASRRDPVSTYAAKNGGRGRANDGAACAVAPISSVRSAVAPTGIDAFVTRRVVWGAESGIGCFAVSLNCLCPVAASRLAGGCWEAEHTRGAGSSPIATAEGVPTALSMLPGSPS
jgi:hypothetical protein